MHSGGAPDVREMWDDFLMKQDEPLYIRNVLSGLAGIMLGRFTLPWNAVASLKELQHFNIHRSLRNINMLGLFRMDGLLYTIAIPVGYVFTAAFFICALVVAGIQNAGFNVVLTGLLLAVWEVGTMWLMRRGPHETSLGFLMGVTIVMNFITIMTAIYWGQLSNCSTSLNGDYNQYSCSNTSAMRGVCAFASIIWVLQLPFIYLLVFRRTTLTRDDGLDGGAYPNYDVGYTPWDKPVGEDPLGGSKGPSMPQSAPPPPPETSDL